LPGLPLDVLTMQSGRMVSKLHDFNKNNTVQLVQVNEDFSEFLTACRKGLS
jgi:hypothetical protein